MSRPLLGKVLVLAGVVLIVGGLVGLSAARTGAADTATIAVSSTTITTVGTTSTTGPPTTTTTTLPTTTTLAVEGVDEFFALFSAALDTDDAESLYARLHPVVVEIYGADVCRAWVEREIVELEEYRPTGPPGTPASRTFQTPGGQRQVEVISVPVSFVFQGQRFEASADLALVDGVMHWLGACR